MSFQEYGKIVEEEAGAHKQALKQRPRFPGGVAMIRHPLIVFQIIGNAGTGYGMFGGKENNKTASHYSVMVVCI